MVLHATPSHREIFLSQVVRLPPIHFECNDCDYIYLPLSLFAFISSIHPTDVEWIRVICMLEINKPYYQIVVALRHQLMVLHIY